jgi:ORF6N domain
LSAGDLGIAPAFSVNVILPRILSFRDQRVILDADLAALYDVPTKRFNEAVKRNLGKFPHDFMFQLTADEFDALRSQFATSNSGRGGRRYSPRVFTEHGALMAATILSSPRAIEVAVYVIRAFVHLRQQAITHHDLAKRLTDLEEQTIGINLAHDSFSRNTRIQIKKPFDALSELAKKSDAMTEPTGPPQLATAKRPIGFIIPDDPSEPK